MPIGRHDIIGLISGSSLDGLDIALCSFDYQIEQNIISITDWDLIRGTTLPFPRDLQDRLRNATDISGLELQLLDVELGKWMGTEVSLFIKENQIQSDFICSHGHTIFHYPEHQMTCQIGHGAMIAALTGLDVISDIRSADMVAGGQGAPFAPVADKFLLPLHDLYLNLGGISNVTYRNGNEMTSWDISPCNQLLNHLAAKKGLEYDRGGMLSEKGEIHDDLRKKLEAHLPLHINEPFSLDNQWIRDRFIPEIDSWSISVEDALATCTSYILKQILCNLEKLSPLSSMYVTGGGALNSFMMQQLKSEAKKLDVEIVIPKKEMVEFKEAAMVALVGLLRKLEIPNSIPSVTGAAYPAIGGAIYYGRRTQHNE